MLLIIGSGGEMAGHIEFFKPVAYWDAFELSYQLYDADLAGRGYVSEAVQLLVDYLFGAKKQHRIHLVIVPGNAGSRRVAEKCGFVLEGTVRGAFFRWAGTQPGRAVLGCGRCSKNRDPARRTWHRVLTTGTRKPERERSGGVGSDEVHVVVGNHRLRLPRRDDTAACPS